MSKPSYQVEVDRETAESWAKLLDLFLDSNIYQTCAYGAVRWGQENLSHLVVKKDGEVLGISQLRIVRPLGLRCGIAYLRWGPLFERRENPVDPEGVAYIAEALRNEYVCKRGLLLRVLPNAFAGSERAALIQSTFVNFKCESPRTGNVYRTLVLDLAPPVEELRRRLEKKWRNSLSRAEKNNLEIAEGTGLEEFRGFRQMYQEMLKRKGFETSVSIEQFERIQEALPCNQRMQILICRKAGVPVAGLVSSAMGDSAIYLLGATSDSGLTASGAYLLQWAWIQRLKERGIKQYDLGGIDPDRDPGPFHFKRGLSGYDSCHITPMLASNGRLSSAIIESSETVSRALLSSARKIQAHASRLLRF